MDGPEFDKLARKLTSFTSRRQALGGLLGAAAAVTGLGAAAEAKKNGKGPKKGAGKHRDDKKGGDKGRKPGKEQCSTGCVTTATAPGGGAPNGSCTSDAQCPVLGVAPFSEQSRCNVGTAECRAFCQADFQCGTAGDCVNNRCRCSGLNNQCPAGSTCRNNFCVAPGSGGGGGTPPGLCTEGLSDAACGANGGTCTNCAAAFNPNRFCAINTTRTGGSCQSSIGCTGTQCQIDNFCVDSLNDPRACGLEVKGGGNFCKRACANGQTCQGTGPSASCSAVVCNANTCPNGCCQATSLPSVFGQLDVFAGCNSGAAQRACGRGGAACVNCTAVCPATNNACQGGVCSCQVTTTAAPTTLPPTTPAQVTTTVAPCGPSNCTGCCRITNGVGVCISSADVDDTNCGAGGGACAQCSGKKHCKTAKGVCRRPRRKRK